MTLTYWTDLPAGVDGWAIHALQTLAQAAGIPDRHVHDPADAVLWYSSARPVVTNGNALWVRREAEVEVPSAAQRRVSALGAPEVHAAIKSGGGSDLPDVVLTTHALLTGALEETLPRDVVGVPMFGVLDPGTAAVIDEPWVLRLSDGLLERLRRLAPGGVARQVPRWPGGERHSIVLSHDVDLPFAWTPPLRQLRRAIARARAGAWNAAARAAGAVALSTAQAARGAARRQADDPNFCFAGWQGAQRELGARSAFYVAVRPAWEFGSATQDVLYGHRDPLLRRAIDEALAAGWEVGLHASITARDGVSRMQEEAHRLRTAVPELTSMGVRHHYWALDAECPEATMWSHAAAGLAYDSSLGMNDRPGFRRGTALPFTPFDVRRSEPVPMLQVPPTMMDGSIFYRPVAPAEAKRRMHAHLDLVRDCGGAAVLDWHLEQLNPARLQGAGPLLLEVLRERDAGDICWMTPLALRDWWLEREKRRAALGQ